MFQRQFGQDAESEAGRLPELALPGNRLTVSQAVHVCSEHTKLLMAHDPRERFRRSQQGVAADGCSFSRIIAGLSSSGTEFENGHALGRHIVRSLPRVDALHARVLDVNLRCEQIRMVRQDAPTRLGHCRPRRQSRQACVSRPS